MSALNFEMMTGLCATLAQSPVNDRIKALRQTADRLDQQSGINEIVPVLAWIGAILLVSVVAYGIYQLFHRWHRVNQLVRRAGLTRGEMAWLRKRADDAGLEPSSRILSSSSAFEQVAISFLSQKLSASSAWPSEARKMRLMADRLGFAPTPEPEEVLTTLDIGSPWPVVVQPEGSDQQTDGFVATDTIDEFVIHIVDDLEALAAVRDGDRVFVRVEDLPDDQPPIFACEVLKLRSKGPYRILRLKHSAEPLGADAMSATPANPSEASTGGSS